MLENVGNTTDPSCSCGQPAGVSPSKPFAPGNLRASRTHRPYADLVLDWARAQRTLRYSGAAVPDVCQLLVRGGGVFTNVTAPGEQPKLRSLFEVRWGGLRVRCPNGA